MKSVLAGIDRGIEYLVAAIFAAMCLVGLLQVFNRFVLNQSLSWSEEFQIFCHVWIVFLAIPIGYRRGAHLYMETIRARFPQKAFDLVVEILWLCFALALAWLAYRVSVVASLQSSPGLDLPMNWAYYSMVAGGLYLALAVLRRLFHYAP